MSQIEAQKVNTSWESIKTVEQLSQSILNDPEKTESFHKFIEEKYWLQSHQEILNVTHDELQDLKNELQSGGTNFENIGERVYEDYMETKLETKWVESVNLDLVLNGIDTPRLTEIKQEFEAYFDSEFKKYDFMSDSQKEIFKLSIVNKLLDSQMSSVGTDMMWKFSDKVTSAATKLQEGEYSQAMELVTDTSDFSEWSDIMKATLDSCMKTYTQKLDAISILIQQKYPALSIHQLQNVFSNIQEFKDPNFIENNFQNFDINSIDFTKVDIFSSQINVDNFKSYILDSRNNIADVAEKLSQWDAMQETVLGLISDKNFWSTMKGFLWILMKLPIIWDMISTFLWLDKSNPMWSLEKLSWKYNFLNWLLNQWKKESKSWFEEGKWVFKNIDFGEQGFQENKKIIWEIMNQLPNMDEKWISQFWQKSFSKEWIQLKWIVLQFNWLDNSDNFDNWVMKSWVLVNILKEWLSKYNNDLWELELLEQQRKQKQQEEKQNEQISQLNSQRELLNNDLSHTSMKISYLQTMINNSQMSEIADWNDWFNIWDITDVAIKDIVNSNKDWYLSLIEETTWEEILEADKEILVELFSNIQEYFSINTHKIWNADLLAVYENTEGRFDDFYTFINDNIVKEQTKHDDLINQQKENDAQLAELWKEATKEELLSRQLLFVEEGDLSQWVKFGENTMLYNPENWELLVWDIAYKLYYNNEETNNFSDIVLDKGMVEFSIWLIDKKVNKISVIKFLQDSLLSDDIESIFHSWDSSITLKRQTV